MGYCDIFYANEEQYYSVNQSRFKFFLDLFQKETGLNWRNLVANSDIENDDFTKIFYELRYIILLYFPKYISTFFKLLEEWGFDVSSEIIDAMKVLCRNTINYIDEGIKEYLKLSPAIDYISNDKGKITIHSDEYGDYSFCSIRKYLALNEKALWLIKNYETQGFCHQMSWELMNYLEQANLITTLLPSYFEGQYYHTVIRNQDGLIIDIANEAVYSDDMRDFLFKGHDVIETEKKDLKIKLSDAIASEDDKSKSINFPNAMLLALHKEYQNINKR